MALSGLIVLTMPDPPPRHVRIHTMPPRKLLDIPILPQIRLAPILHIVIDGDNNLVRILNPRRTERHELLRDRKRVIVAHDLVRLKSHVVARVHEFAVREADGVALCDFLGQGLRDWASFLEGGQEGGGEGVGELGVEGLDILCFSSRRARVGDVSGC